MKLMDELNHRLTSKSRMRSLFKDASVDDLGKVLKRLREIYEEKLQTKEELSIQRQKKMNDIALIQKEMADLGITLADLDINESVSVRRKIATRHTFEYQNAVGETIYWHGSSTGRVPKEFQDFLNKTQKKRMDCVVE